MRPYRTRNLTLTFAIASGLGISVPAGIALAQDVPSAAPTGLEEVVVTARKREERLQDVPIAVSAVSAETIEREQINSVKEIAAFTPGLVINSDAVGRAFLSIRGIGTTLIDSVQPGVGIFIDGIYQANTSYLNNPVLDVERIEVLKGPQGTLFGNNTLGGAINVITRAPSDVLTGKFSADFAGPDSYQTYAGSLSGPIVEGTLRGRVAASYHTHDGFSDNDLAGGDARPFDNRAVNATLAWDPGDSASITLNGYYNSVEGPQTAYANPSGPKDYLEDVTLNQNSIAKYEYTGVNAKGVFGIASNTKLTAVLAYDDKDGTAAGDGDYGPVPFAVVHGGHNTLKTRTAELRLDTEWNDRVSTLIGVFANQTDGTNFFFTDLPLFGLVDLPNSVSSDSSANAVFANVFWDLTDTLEFSAGLRFDKQEVNQQNLLIGTDFHYEADEWQPRVTLTKHWSEDFMTYGSIARGFRGGGTNSPGAPNPVYDGDSVWSYELGSKLAAAGGALSLNAAVYYNDYSDYIGQNSLYPVGGTFIAINLNSGDVESYGAELEAVWQATDRFSLQAGLSLNHTRITDDSAYENTIGEPLGSDRILFLPDWTASAAANYDWPIGDEDTVRFSGTLIGKGDRIGSSLDPTFTPILEAYSLANASVTWLHGRWSVAVWGTNLTDETYYESYLDDSLLSKAGFVGPLVNNLGITNDGRRIGIKVGVEF